MYVETAAVAERWWRPVWRPEGLLFSLPLLAVSEMRRGSRAAAVAIMCVCLDQEGALFVLDWCWNIYRTRRTWWVPYVMCEACLEMLTQIIWSKYLATSCLVWVHAGGGRGGVSMAMAGLNGVYAARGNYSDRGE